MTLSPFLENVLIWCLAGLLVAAGLSVYRMMIGPRAGDRAVAFDTLATVFIGVICVMCMMWNSTYYFDAVWVLTLVGFLGTATMARYLERGRVF